LATASLATKHLTISKLQKSSCLKTAITNSNIVVFLKIENVVFL
jgi:hypothetical protein